MTRSGVGLRDSAVTLDVDVRTTDRFVDNTQIMRQCISEQ